MSVEDCLIWLSKTDIIVATNEMKRLFPGNYDLEKFLEPVSNNYQYRLIFSTEQDRIWFRLRYQ